MVFCLSIVQTRRRVTGSGTSAENVYFLYDYDHNRWAQTYVGNGTDETTIYIGGLMEITGNDTGGVYYRYYIYAGSEPVAVLSRTIQVNTNVTALSYFLSDNQSSVAKITNSTGGVVVGESFTPFGNRRNPGTWSGPASTSDLTTAAGVSREGYTFQTQLGLWMGLNHMNGRVQDAITGRFLSPDPTIPDPQDAQSYNRYSYTQNNPLTFTDPTGFSATDQTADNREQLNITFSSMWAAAALGQPSYWYAGLAFSGNQTPQNGSSSGGGSGQSSSAPGALPGDASAAQPSSQGPAASSSQPGPTQASQGGQSLQESQDQDLSEIVVQASRRVFPVENPGWDVVGLDFIQGIESNDARYLTHIRPRHASNAPYPQSPRNGRFLAPILSLSTPKDQFDIELGLLFNEYTPSFFEPTPAGLALEFVLPDFVGQDLNNVLTRSWTVVLRPVGSGIYQLWTTYPGQPALGN